MSTDFRFVQKQLLVVITWPAMEPDVLMTRATIEALLADPRLKPGYAVVSDWRHETGAPTSGYIQSFMELLRDAERRGITRWATVVPTASLAAYGVGRMAETNAELRNLSYRVFRDYDEAVRWASEGD
jgi:hypothetical protein